MHTVRRYYAQRDGDLHWVIVVVCECMWHVYIYVDVAVLHHPEIIADAEELLMWKFIEHDGTWPFAPRERDTIASTDSSS